MRNSKRVILSVLLFCAVIAPGFAGTIKSIEFGLAQGGSAVYNATAGTIAWSGGASGAIELIDGTVIPFDQSSNAGVTITGSASNGGGMGDFLSLSNLSFTLTYGPYGQTLNSAIIVSGTLSSGATYDEIKFGSDLSGFATVDVMAYAVNDPFGETYQWVEPTGSSLLTSIKGIGSSYNYSQDYNVNNLVIRVFGEVPEPATMVLLGIGAVGMLIKRKKV